MSRKRRRVSDAGEGRSQNVPAPQQDNSFAAHSRKPPGEVWYADGNIILATKKHLFRVHKSVLAKHSTVFADMLKFDLERVDGQHGGAMDAVNDRSEGVLTVQLTGDRDEDVTTVLRSLYDHNFYVVGSPIPICTIFSLLRMAAKYDLRTIRADMVKHLSAFFPESYEGYKRLGCAASVKNLGFTDQELFTLLALVRRNDSKIIQPFLFYLCADRPPSQIVELSGPLKKEDLIRCLDGREKVQKRAYQMFFAALQYENCGNDFLQILNEKGLCFDFECMALFRSQLEQRLRFDNYDTPVFPLGTRLGLLEGVPEYPLGDIHEECAKRYVDKLSTIQKSLWEDLPLIFGLGNWDQVKGVIIVADE